MVLRRDLSYDLFSREPEDWAVWAGFARDHYTAKREPSPVQSKVPFRPKHATIGGPLAAFAHH